MVSRTPEVGRNRTTERGDAVGLKGQRSPEFRFSRYFLENSTGCRNQRGMGAQIQRETGRGACPSAVDRSL